MNSKSRLLVCLLAGLSLAPSAQASQVIFDKTVTASFTAVDPAGNLYMIDGGSLTKLDASGNLVFRKTYPGFTGNSSRIAVNAAGEVVLVGNTQYDNLPTSPSVFQPARNNKGTCVGGDKNQAPLPCTDAFVVKFDATGNLAWATYLGGMGNDAATAVALDSAGNVYVVGTSGSSDFPLQSSLVNGSSGMFLAKINAAGTKLVFSTYLASAGAALPLALKLDASGNIYIAGNAVNAVFPTMPIGATLSCPQSATQSTEAFFAKITSTGDRVLLTGCLASATASVTSASALALDATGNIYLAGMTNASDFPVTAGAYQPNATPPTSGSSFVTKISPDGSTLVYSSRFAGAPGPSSLAVDSTGAAYVTGQMFGTNLPITGPARQTCAGPTALENRFLVKLSPDGFQALYSSFDDPTVANATLDIGGDNALTETYFAQPNSINDRVVKIANIDQASGPLFSPLCTLNGASFASHYPTYPLLPGISPGEIVTLKGVGLGPTTGVGATTSSGVITSYNGGVQVYFDGVAAPLLYVQDRQINVVAPYDLAGKTQSNIQVVYGGQFSPTATLPVSTVSPALFMNFDTGLPLILNSDYTQNSATHPLNAGSVLVMYITGGGQTSPASFNGEIVPGAGGLQAAVTAKLSIIGINGPNAIDVPLTIQYAGPAPGETSGVQQINVQIPSDFPHVYFAAGVSMFLTVTIGDQSVYAQVYGPGA